MYLLLLLPQVRKHCRQRHLEWLRRLGHGCPALYCRWEGA